jgi:hypothetical protein
MKGVKAAPCLPFKEWVDDGAKSAIAGSMQAERPRTPPGRGKIGGKAYVCQSAGLSGLKSADACLS